MKCFLITMLTITLAQQNSVYSSDDHSLSQMEPGHVSISGAKAIEPVAPAPVLYSPKDFLWRLSNPQTQKPPVEETPKGPSIIFYNKEHKTPYEEETHHTINSPFETDQRLTLLESKIAKLLIQLTDLEKELVHMKQYEPFMTNIMQQLGISIPPSLTRTDIATSSSDDPPTPSTSPLQTSTGPIPYFNQILPADSCPDPESSDFDQFSAPKKRDPMLFEENKSRGTSPLPPKTPTPCLIPIYE